MDPRESFSATSSLPSSQADCLLLGNFDPEFYGCADINNFLVSVLSEMRESNFFIVTPVPRYPSRQHFKTVPAWRITVTKVGRATVIRCPVVCWMGRPFENLTLAITSFFVLSYLVVFKKCRNFFLVVPSIALSFPLLITNCFTKIYVHFHFQDLEFELFAKEKIFLQRCLLKFEKLLICKLSSKISTISPPMQNNLVARYHRPVYLFQNTCIFENSIKNYNVIKRNKSVFRIIYMGSLNKKFRSDVIHLVENCCQGLNAEFHFFGVGNFKGVVDPLGLQKNFFYHDFIQASEIVKLQGFADALIVFNDFGDDKLYFPSKIIMGLALGVPIMMESAGSEYYKKFLDKVGIDLSESRSVINNRIISLLNRGVDSKKTVFIKKYYSIFFSQRVFRSNVEKLLGVR